LDDEESEAMKAMRVSRSEAASQRGWMAPTLETARLILRPLRAGDAARFLALAGEWDVARMTSDIPHPLAPEQARAWLDCGDSDVRFAIEHGGLMVGSAGYFGRRSGAAELGFWLGRDHWGFGFGTEAATAVVRYGFGCGRRSFTSSHFVDNAASAHVLAKIGFEAMGQGPMWCAARGCEVEAVALWLSRERAEERLGPLPGPARPLPDWASRIGRWIGSPGRYAR
jgi:RimJ/RimL family protein N-acetyltransferase